MKKFLILGLLWCFYTAKAQTNVNDKIGGSFVTKVSVVVNPYDDQKEGQQKIIKNIHYLLNDGTRFFVYDVIDGGYVISVWDFKDSITVSENVKGNRVTDTINKKRFYSRISADNSLPIVGTNDYYKMSKAQVGMSEDEVPDSLKGRTSPQYLKFRKLAYVDSWGNNMRFFMSNADFNNKCQIIYPSLKTFTWGFLSLPIKARIFNRFSFEEKVNFGISFGLKIQRPTTVYSAHNFLAGVSISDVRVDSTNAVHYSTALTSASAFSVSAGYMYQFDKFQIGIFIGTDYISNNAAIGWRYQGVPWIGVGLGLSLFNENQAKPAPDQSQVDRN